MQHLPLADGGGFVATVPELPECMSDGETIGEARANVADAIGCWLAAAWRSKIPPDMRARWATLQRQHFDGLAHRLGR
nr:type II toxin-antitoxin system HicB family antitoxin [Methylobacterium aquaticum]